MGFDSACALKKGDSTPCKKNAWNQMPNNSQGGGFCPGKNLVKNLCPILFFRGKVLSV
jgi:hypothetical protein